MARAVTVTKSLTAAVVNAISAAQALAAAGDLVINGTLATGGVATLDSQRRVSLLSSGNDSALVWTIYGANDAGAAISEAVPGGNAAAVATQQDFATVTRVASSGAVAGTVQVGTSAVGSSPWQVPNPHITPFVMGFENEVVAGAPVFTIETTQTSPLAPMPIYQTGGYGPQAAPVPTAIGWPGMTGLAVSGQGAVNTPIAAWRLTLTTVGTARATAIQAGIVGN
jgi:hypothetical protein